MPPRLRPYVAALSGYPFDGLEPGGHVGLPGPHLTVREVPPARPLAGAAPTHWLAQDSLAAAWSG